MFNYFQSMLSLNQRFDENKFNFTRIDPEKELVFKLKKTDETRLVSIENMSWIQNFKILDPTIVQDILKWIT